MTSQFGFIPKERQTLANGLVASTDGSVIYAAPAHISSVTSLVTTEAAETLAVADALCGMIMVTPAQALSISWPTAAQLVAGFNGAVVGAGVRLIVRRVGGTGDITMTTATGLSLDGTLIITTGRTGEFLVVFTNVTPGSEAATIYTISSASVH
jgi:hypothetical protein